MNIKIYKFLSSDLFAKISMGTYVGIVVGAELIHYYQPELFYCFPLEILGALGWGFATSEIMAFADYVLEEYADLFEDEEDYSLEEEVDTKEMVREKGKKFSKLNRVKKIREERKVKGKEKIEKKEIRKEKNETEAKEEIIDNSEYKYVVEVFYEYSIKYKLIKEELQEEWENYLTYTVIDKESMEWVRNLISKLVLLNTASLEEVIEKVNDYNDMISLLCHFGRNGNDLARSLNRADIIKKRVQRSKLGC